MPTTVASGASTWLSILPQWPTPDPTSSTERTLSSPTRRAHTSMWSRFHQKSRSARKKCAECGACASSAPMRAIVAALAPNAPGEAEIHAVSFPGELCARYDDRDSGVPRQLPAQRHCHPEVLARMIAPARLAPAELATVREQRGPARAPVAAPEAVA